MGGVWIFQTFHLVSDAYISRMVRLKEQMRLLFRMLSILRMGWGLLLGFVCYQSVYAHPISMSTAVADIYQDRIQVELRILTEDLMFYHSLEADGEQMLARDALTKAAMEHCQFLSKYFRVFDKDGNVMEGTFVEVDVEEIPEQGVRLDQVMDVGVYYQLRIELEAQPDYLTFSQNFGGDEAPVPAVMDLILLQNGARLDFPVQIGPRSPHSVAIDWENPPRMDRMYWRERRAMMKQRREELLGITSYSSTYAYLYVEPHELRFEILVPLLTLDTWFPVDRKDKDILSIKEQTQLKESLDSFLQQHCSALIDGVKVAPALSRLDFFTLDIRDFAKGSDPRPVGMQNGRAGMIMRFSTKGVPRSASIEWSFFNDYTPMLNTMVYTFDERGKRHFFTDNEPKWEWNGASSSPSGFVSADVSQFNVPGPVVSLSVPGCLLGLLGLGLLVYGWGSGRSSLLGFGVGGLLLGGVLWRLGQAQVPSSLGSIPAPALDQQSLIAEALLKNVYRAFDYRRDEQVYDALAQSASGDFLEALYLQIKDGLVVQEQGGARANVRELNWISAEPLAPSIDDASFALDVSWEATGTVEHWGHVHTRQHSYRAVFEFSGTEGSWKMVGMEVKSEALLKSITGLRNAA